jgi:hypothetical protein
VQPVTGPGAVPVLLPALAVLWSEVRGRGSVLVTIGVWGSVLGVLGFVSSALLNLLTVALAGTSSGIESFTAVKDSGTIALVVVLPILLGLVALVVLFAGLARAGLAGWWLSVAGGVSVVLDQVTSESGNAIVLAAAFLPMAIALTTVGVRLATRPAADAPAPVAVASSTV